MSNVKDRIDDYLRSGGLFNPEMADHDAVRDLLMDAKDSILSLERELERWRHNTMIEGDYICPDSVRMTLLEKALVEHAAQGLDRDGLCWCFYVRLVHPSDDRDDAVPTRNGHTDDCWAIRKLLPYNKGISLR